MAQTDESRRRVEIPLAETRRNGSESVAQQLSQLQQKQELMTQQMSQMTLQQQVATHDLVSGNHDMMCGVQALGAMAQPLQMMMPMINTIVPELCELAIEKGADYAYWEFDLSVGVEESVVIE